MLAEKSVSNANGRSIAGLIFTYLTFHIAYGLSDPQIIVSTNAPKTEYPYQVSLKTAVDGNHFCSGAIVSKRIVITAGHCLYGYNPSDVFIDVGSSSLHSFEKRYTADKLIIHPSYSQDVLLMSRHKNDIGLINLTTQISFSENIKSINLIFYDTDYVDVHFLVTGWGRFSPRGQMSELLQQFTATGFSQMGCSNTYKFVTKNEICVLNTSDQRMCVGDGSPLKYNSALVGIMSYSTFPCTGGNPDVFTKVYYYKEWIEAWINKTDWQAAINN